MSTVCAVPLYDVFETAIELPSSSANPLNVSVRGRFVQDPDEPIHVDAYYDGNGIYRLRFMPTALGLWRYQISVAHKVLENGEFTCVPSDLTGPLRLHPNSPYHMQFANGAPFYMLGNTAYNALLTYQHDPNALGAFLDYYQTRGFNWVRFALMQTTWPTAGDLLWPWGGTPSDPDYERLDLAYLGRIEAFVQELARRDIIASVVLFMPADRTLEGIPWEPLERFVRHAVARLGAYWNVVWNLANEWQRENVFSYERMDALGQLVHDIDPYGCLTACHHYARCEFHDRDWTDMSSIQHRGLPHEVHRVMLQNRLCGKVTINEEYGYEADTLRPPNDPDNVRRDHWAIAMAGGYGSYGDKTGGPKVGTYFSGNLADSTGVEVPDALRHLVTFMQSVDYVAMSPADACLSACDRDEVFCLAHLGREYVVYLVRGQSFNLSLIHLHGRAEARWFNPRTGEWAEGERSLALLDSEALSRGEDGETAWTKISQRMTIAFQAPDENDWVLHVRRQEA